ncbi:hypothetical protein V8C34DRAFT_317600 [Trichoderma compactum]
MATKILPAPLERLPLHPLEDGGLTAFSLANRQCASAALRFRLRHVQLKINELNQDENFTFIDMISDIDIRLGCVRSLRISDTLGFEDDAEQDEIGCEEIEEESFFAKPSPLCPSRLKSTAYKPDKLQLPEEVLQMKITRLSYLSDLVYDCISQVPMCLLSALRDNRPDTRLHVYTFSLRSLYQPRDEYYDISPEEYALTTSPNLYGIGYNEEAVIQMVRGLAPRLSYVSMAGQPIGNTIELAHAYQLHRQSGKPKWKSFFINDSRACDTVHKKGSLHTLYLDGASELRIHQWSGYTDFDKLTKLHLGNTTVDAVQTLANIGESGGLSSLSSLALMLVTWNLEQTMAADASAVIDQHGNSLRELWFVPASDYYDNIEALMLSCDRIRLPSGICVNLEKLELRLPRLKRISLVLDCSVIDPPEVRHGQSFIEMGGWELPANAFRAALINNAMDSTLARSIFETVAPARAYTGGSSLVDQKLKIHGAGNFGRFSVDNETKIPLEWVGQSWFVKRRPRDGGLVIQKIKTFVNDLDVLKDDLPERDDLRAIRTDIRPGSPGDRRNEWHSFPLTRSAD